MLKIFDKVSDGALPIILPTEIICGDCSGDAKLPIRTNLTNAGRCAVCGGRSFVIASRLCGALSQHLKDKIKEERNINYATFTHTETTGSIIEINSEL